MGKDFGTYFEEVQLVKNMLHYFRLISLILCTVLASACGSSMKHAKAPTEPIVVPTVFDIVIDSRFSGPEVALIGKSLREWEESSGGVIKFEVRAKKVDINQEISVEDVKHDEDGCSNLTVIVRGTSQDPFVRKIEKAIHSKIGGYTDKHCEMSAVIIVSDRMDNATEFKEVMTHEIGHLIGLMHIPVPEESVMFPGMDHSTPCITQLDLKELCMIYECDAKKLKPVCYSVK